MGKLIDLTGKRYGRLIVLKRAKDNDCHNKPRWLCKCDCGNVLEVSGASLKSGNTKSCGCLNRDLLTKHGRSGQRIYHVWRNMISRCYRATDQHWKDYGARGIKVCDAWKNSMEEFIKWAEQSGYESHLTIDRIDVDGDYTPENCRWADVKTQNNNKRSSVRIEYKGGVYSLAEFARATNLSKSVVFKRYKAGYTPEEIIHPLNGRMKHGSNIKSIKTG